MRLFRDPAFSVMKETRDHKQEGKQETTFINLRPMSGILRLVFVFD